MTKLLTPSQVAEIAQLPTDSVYRLLKRGEIPGRKVGGSWRIPEDWFDAVPSPERSPAAPRPHSNNRKGWNP